VAPACDVFILLPNSHSDGLPYAPVSRLSNVVTDIPYRAFISFSHESDEKLAVALQAALSRFAKPWYRTRSMRVFQDAASLSANPGLWDSIQQALAQSEFLVLLASPASAQSRWVQQETDWWVKNRSVGKLVICLTDGTILWDNAAAAFDWDKTNAIPASLRHAFAAEPLYADFRAAKAAGTLRSSDPAFRSALLNVAAPLLGRPKDELDSEDIRLHRKARRTALAAAVFIVMLGLLAGVASNTAHQRQKIAASRALASEAASPQEDRTLGLLLSIESRRIVDTVESRRALLSTLQQLPHVESFLWGHTDAVTRAVFSPDGKTVLSAGWDNRIIEWDTASHQPKGDPIDTPQGLVGVAFDTEGARFASTATGAVVIRDAATGRPLGEPFKADEDFLHVAFSPDGKLIAASTAAYGAHPSKVYIWDIASHRPFVDSLLGSNFAFSPDSARLAIAQYEAVFLYDLKTHRLGRQPLTGHTKNIASIAFSADGALLAAGAEDNAVVLWDVKRQRALGTLKGHAATVESLLFDPGAAFLYSGSHDGTLFKWNLESLEAAGTLVKNVRAAISSIFLTPDGHLKSLALDQQRVVMLEVNDDPPLGRHVKAPDSHNSNIAFSPDGRLLASGAEFGGIALWNVATGQPDGIPLPGHERQVTGVAFTPDGKELISASMDGSIIFWNLDSRSALGPQVHADRSPVWSLAGSPDGKTLAAGGDAQLVYWDTATRQQRGPPTDSQKDRLWALAFSPDGALLASAGNDLQTDLWRTEQQGVLDKTVGTPTQDNVELMPVGLAFSPNGALLATSAPQHAVALWDVKSGQPLLPALVGHSQAVTGVAFSGDGGLLASGSADGDIRLWDMATHELIGTLSFQQKAIHGIAMEQSRQLLASVDEDDNLVFWNAAVEDWVTRACRIANRNLSTQEWKTYVGAGTPKKTCPDLTSVSH
jgi:WD40 repeat protein